MWDPERHKLYFKIKHIYKPIARDVFKRLVVWPLVVFKEIKFQIRMRGKDPYGLIALQEEMDEEFPKFKITQEHLIASFSVQEIETRETVFDPLGMAPNLPFGHLNNSWRDFLEKVDPTCEIWSFCTPWEGMAYPE